MDLDEAARAFRDFVAVIKALRTPGTGCPWDLEQDQYTLRPYLVEETYEVLDAIDRGDEGAFREELGDLLLQIVLHAQVADDRGVFSITEVLRGITEKMVRRHPHVFGGVRVSSSAEVVRNWEQIKAAEARGQGREAASTDALARVPDSLPALLRAQRLGEKAAQAGFDRVSFADVVDSVREHFAELQKDVQTVADELPAGAQPADVTQGLSDGLRSRLEQELGDVLFSACQLARWLGVDAEHSMRTATNRFVVRFRSREPQPS